MCINFIDLNKACPRTSYTLPNINKLVDTTADYVYFSFLDAMYSYHQIHMDKDDEENISFIFKESTYNYRAMPYWLKKYMSNLLANYE